jgi:Flp pilus assembly pilin Flp
MQETYNKLTVMIWSFMTSAILFVQAGASPRRLNRSNGQTVLEWILIAVAVSIAVFFAYSAIGDAIRTWITSSILARFN